MSVTDSPMAYLPIFIDVREARCVVVGGGAQAARKVRLLRKAGARVRVVAPALGDELTETARDGLIDHAARKFEPPDLDDCRLAIAATDDAATNRLVASLARESNLPVNVVDAPALCSFIMPSIVDRSPVQIAISTGGASPVLARLLRTRMESFIPAAYGTLAGLLEKYRERAKQRITDAGRRRDFWEQVLQGPVAEMVLAGQEDAADAALHEALSSGHTELPRGEVSLVGAGPGDPDLLTFRALRLMQQADVVVYDRLVSAPILELVRRDAERIYAGKARADHTLAQENINELLVRLARDGNRVVRLKGGDPFIFGRGGEEISTLLEHGVPFQVVPGITAASGCATYAGIPLTHRDYSQACVFVTGHLKDGTVDLNYAMLAQPNQTVVVYMGLHGIDIVCRELIAHGRAAQTPAALIQQGTTSAQRVFVATLDSLPGVVKQHKVTAPTLIIIGEVVQVHERLGWYQHGREVRVADPQREPADDATPRND